MLIHKTYDGDHFAIYTNTKSFYYVPEVNIMFYVNKTSIYKFLTFKKKWEKKNGEEKRESALFSSWLAARSGKN